MPPSFARNVRPIEHRAGLHVGRHAEIALEDFGARGGGAELGRAALQKRRTQRHVLRPARSGGRRREILHRLHDLDGTPAGRSAHLPVKVELRDGEIARASSVPAGLA